MVHSLEETHRLLEPVGVLIDIHPVPNWSFIKLVHLGEVIFERQMPEDDWQDVLMAESALAKAAERGLYIAQGSQDFNFLAYTSASMNSGPIGRIWMPLTRARWIGR